MRWPVLAAMVAMALAGCDRTGEHGAPPSPPSAASVAPFDFPPDAVLLVTCGSDGMLEACNCAGTLEGGLSRRSGLFASYRAAFARTFALDAGDFSWLDAADLRNEYLLRAYRFVDYDAIALGVGEMSATPAQLARQMRRAPLPYLAGTVSPADRSVRWPAARVVRRQWGDVRLAVLSYLPRESLLFAPAETVEALAFQFDADFAAQAAVLRSEGCVVIVVCQGDDETAEKLASWCPADVIVRGRTSRSLPAVRSAAGGARIVQAGGWDVVGALAMRIEGGKLTQVQWRLEPVDTRWSVDRRALSVFQAYARLAARKALDAERGANVRHVAPTECAKCHPAQFAAWKASPHARARAALAAGGRADDENCLACHVGGFRAPGGFVSAAQSPDREDVGCQDCHRFNLDEHRAADFQRRPADEKVCTLCHTPLTDPGFRYDARAAKARCPRR